MADSRLSGTIGEPVVGGRIGFGGELDLLSVFEINADNLGAYALANLGIHDDLAGRIPGRPGMVQAVIRYALRDLGLPRVVAETQTANIASCRLLEGLGLRRERTVQRFGAQQAIYVTDGQLIP